MKTVAGIKQHIRELKDLLIECDYHTTEGKLKKAKLIQEIEQYQKILLILMEKYSKNNNSNRYNKII